MFAAALPQPAHNMPGGTLATGIRDALTASSFRAHVVRDSLACLPGKASDKTPAPSLLWGTLTAEIPGSAGCQCVDAREVHQLATSGMPFSVFLDLVLPLAGVEPTRPWRDLTDHISHVTVTKGGAVWLTLRELDRVLPIIPGHEAKRFRLQLKRGGWKPSSGATG